MTRRCRPAVAARLRHAVRCEVTLMTRPGWRAEMVAPDLAPSRPVAAPHCAARLHVSLRRAVTRIINDGYDGCRRCQTRQRWRLRPLLRGASHDKCVCYTATGMCECGAPPRMVCQRPAEEALMTLSTVQACTSREAFREARRSAPEACRGLRISCEACDGSLANCHHGGFVEFGRALEVS